VAAAGQRAQRRRPEAAAPAASREAVLRAALAAFVEQGFHGTSMRDIAARAGTVVSHAYYYFPSKADLLRTLMVGVTEDLIAALEAARARAGPNPATRLAAIVRAHVRLHTERQAEAFVGNTELRSLNAKDRAAVVALRDRVSAVFKAAVDDGLRAGAFRCPHRDAAVLAIVTMCTAVAGWYRAGGPLPPAAVADRYAALALAMLGCCGPTRSDGGRGATPG
jgi:AcrR family transcriptional regulator